MNGHPMNDMNVDEAYRTLCLTVCELAVDDYRKALSMNATYTAKSLERFFLSDWFILLCDGLVEGQMVIDEVKRQWTKEQMLKRS
jgi:hypothetical protein